MNLITNTMRALVRRRLWPVALLLVAALVAVPMTLAKTPEPAPAVPAATTAKAQEAETISQPIVELRDTTATTAKKQRRRVLGQAKDPFAPAPLPKAKTKKKAKTAQATPTATPDTGTDSGSGAGPGSSGGGSSAPPSAAPTPDPTVTIPKGTIKARFGVPSDTTDTELPELLIGHLEALPSADAPIVVLERLKDNGKTAVFSIPGEITAVGDGKCQPNPQECTSLELRAGQTEFITVKGGAQDGTDVQYQLDLMKIYTKATKVPKDSVPVTDGASS